MIVSKKMGRGSADQRVYGRAYRRKDDALTLISATSYCGTWQASRSRAPEKP